MKLTRDEAMRIHDKFEDFIFGLVGQEIVFKRLPDQFSVELVRKPKQSEVVK